MRSSASAFHCLEEEFLERLRAWIVSNVPFDITGGVPVRGMWGIRCNFQPRPRERKFAYQILVAQTSGQGACYYDGAELRSEMLRRLIGRTYRCARLANRGLDIALLDSVAASIITTPDLIESKVGSYGEKALWRASIIATEVGRVADSLRINQPVTVCNLGVVSLVVNELLNRGYRVLASDFDPTLIGRTLFGSVRVTDARYNNDLLAAADVAVVTGMALSTRTLAQLIEDCRRHHTKLIVFAETGASFAPFYVANGVDGVIAEPFPFYTFDGYTQINVYRSSS